MNKNNQIFEMSKTISQLKQKIKELKLELRSLRTLIKMEKNSFPHLLVVEDNSIALRLIETLAKNTGCNITSVANGENALKLAQNFNFDLILTDIGLPGISGQELTERIRADEKKTKKKSIPIIGITAQALNNFEDYLRSGMNKVFSKPINFNLMRVIIKTFVDHPNHSLVDKMASIDQKNSKELYNLDPLPLLDLKQAKHILGEEATLNEFLTLLNQKSIPEDEKQIKKAYLQKDWQSIENIAHRMKSGAMYCGAIKMQYACQNLENNCKTGKIKLLETLYQQLLKVLEETKELIKYRH
ncbi:MAG: response regulator [Proteobacteria bacterium]|nr:response regulator [Pseudomonadota bacterium]